MDQGEPFKGRALDDQVDQSGKHLGHRHQAEQDGHFGQQQNRRQCLADDHFPKGADQEPQKDSQKRSAAVKPINKALDAL